MDQKREEDDGKDRGEEEVRSCVVVLQLLILVVSAKGVLKA